MILFFIVDFISDYHILDLIADLISLEIALISLFPNTDY